MYIRAEIAHETFEVYQSKTLIPHLNKELNQTFIFQSSSYKNIQTDYIQKCVRDLREALSI